MNPKGKGRSWQHCDASWLHIRALEEVEELWLAMDVGGAEAVLDEAADVGNFLMMMCDVIQKGVSDGNAETS
jgi:NTP pyrophosphatase (non-canonical NTP hydrolase)